jgi:hypothetical protein
MYRQESSQERQAQVISNSGHDEMIVSQHISSLRSINASMMQKTPADFRPVIKSAIRKRVSFSEQHMAETSLLDESPSEGTFVLFI